MIYLTLMVYQGSWNRYRAEANVLFREHYSTNYIVVFPNPKSGWLPPIIREEYYVWLRILAKMGTFLAPEGQISVPPWYWWGNLSHHPTYTRLHTARQWWTYTAWIVLILNRTFYCRFRAVSNVVIYLITMNELIAVDCRWNVSFQPAGVVCSAWNKMAQIPCN